MADPLKVKLPPPRPVTVRPAKPKERAEVPLYRQILAGLPTFAADCDTSIPTVRHWISQGMPVIRGGAAGGRLLIPVRLAEAWLELQAVSAGEEVA